MRTTMTIGAAVLAAVFGAASVAPAAAASFNFGFGFNNGPGFYTHGQTHHHWRGHRHVYHPSIHRYPRYPRGGISIDIGPLHLSAGHVSRCEARFRTYDRHSDTYMGFDHRRHYCRL